MTLVELLVAMVISTLLIAFFFHADVMVKRCLSRWIAKSGFEETLMLVRKQLQVDLPAADSIVERTGLNVLLAYTASGPMRYDFNRETVLRNEKPLLPPEIHLKSWCFAPLDPRPQRSLLPVGFEGATAFLLKIELTGDDNQSCTLIVPVRPWKLRKLSGA